MVWFQLGYYLHDLDNRFNLFSGYVIGICRFGVLIKTRSMIFSSLQMLSLRQLELLVWLKVPRLDYLMLLLLHHNLLIRDHHQLRLIQMECMISFHSTEYFINGQIEVLYTLHICIVFCTVNYPFLFNFFFTGFPPLYLHGDQMTCAIFLREKEEIIFFFFLM